MVILRDQDLRLLLVGLRRGYPMLVSLWLAACAPPPEPPRVQPPADPPPASSAAKEPAPTAEHSVRGLGPFVPLDLFPPAELRPESFEVRSFRKGLIAVASYENHQRCPDAPSLPSSCRAVLYYPFTEAAQQGDNWAKKIEPGSVGPWKMLPGNGFDGRPVQGKDAVILVGRDGKSLAVADDAGVREFSIPDSSGVTEALHVLETSEGKALLGRTATRLRGQEVEVIAVYPLELNGSQVSLGKPSVMPFSFATSIGEGVFLRSAGRRSALRIAPRLSIKPSGELENTWLMTWIEPVVPVRRGPPRVLPGSTLWETEDSLPLDAENIPKRVHQLRLDRRGKIKADKVITAGLSESDAAPEVSPPVVMGRPVQTPERLSFYAEDKVGRVVFRGATALWSVSFDERGRVLGPPTPASQDSPPETAVVNGWKISERPDLARIAPDCSLGVDVSAGHSVLLCDEPHEGRKPGRLGLRVYRE